MCECEQLEHGGDFRARGSPSHNPESSSVFHLDTENCQATGFSRSSKPSRRRLHTTSIGIPADCLDNTGSREATLMADYRYFRALLIHRRHVENASMEECFSNGLWSINTRSQLN